MTELKSLIVLAVSSLISLFSPIKDMLVAMLILFCVNGAFGLLADIFSGNGWNTKKALSFLFAALLTSLVLNVYQWESNQSVSERTDTVYSLKLDTVHERTPILVRERKVRELVVYGQRQIKADSTVENTNDSVMLPITQKIYHKDSLYTAWVSGYMPQLDSISIFSPKKIITITKTEKTKRWNVGVIGGYGVGLRYGKAEPFVGVGVMVRLF